jgi:hypothetical protein
VADQVLPSKLIGERVTVIFDFVDQLDWGEAVLEASVSISVLVGLDNNPSDLLYLSAVFDGRLVRQQIWHGLPGVIYQIKCSVLGTSGSEYSKLVKLAILPDVSELPPLNALYLTSRPYPIVSVEGIISTEAPQHGFMMEMSVEQILSSFLVLQGDLYGGLKAFTAPVEAIDSSFAVMEGFLYGGLVSFSNTEAINSDSLVVSGDLYGGLVEYSFNESLDSSFTVVSGALT